MPTLSDSARFPGTPIDLIVFDLDGTLIDSEEDLALSVNAVREHLGMEPLPYDTVASYVGRGVVILMRRALGESASEDLAKRAVEMFLEYYRDHMLDHTVPYPGVPEALEQLQSRRMAVLTNKPVRFSRAILEGLGLYRHFARVYGGNSFEQKKPDPVGLLALMREFNLPASRILMVGDSDTDVLTGRNAGAWTCGVTYGLAPESLETSPPDLLVDDLRQLSTLLNGELEFPEPQSAGTL
jgi:phosphoglycolate phosphatase